MSTAASQTADQKVAAHVQHAIELLHAPGAVFEIRALKVRKGQRYTANTVSGYFDDPVKAGLAAAELSGQAAGVYITLNEIDPSLLARRANRVVEVKGDPTTADKDVIRRRWILIDCDCTRPAGISATTLEVEAARAVADTIENWLKQEGFPACVRADSGNGAHLLLPVDLPNDDGGLVQRFLGALNGRFGTDSVKVDTSVHNPARITKCYGTRTCKGDSTEDRPWRWAQVTQAAEWKPTPRALIEQHAEPAQVPATARPSSTRVPAGGFELADWIAGHIAGAKGPSPWSEGPRKWVIPICPFNSDHSIGEAFITENTSGAIGAGCRHDSCKWTWRDLREQYEPGCYDKTERSQADASWPKPRPIGAELRSVMAFDEALLPESLRPWVLDVAKRMQCPIDFVAAAAMVMLSSAIGRRIQICLKQNDPWQLPANLWGGTVGRPGANKSAPTAAALEPLRALQADKLRDFHQEKKKHDFEITVAKERLALRDSEIKKALKRGATATELEALRQEHSDDSEPPHALRLEVNDTTIAKLGETLAQNKFGVLMYRDELTGFLSQLDRAGAEGDRQFYLECWNGNGRFIIDRIGRGTTSVEGLCVSVVGTLQPGPLEGYLKASMGRGADGFIQRFQLLVYPDPVPEWEFVDAAPDRVAIERVCKVVEDLVSLGETIESRDGKPLVVRFSKDAQAVYADWLTDLQRVRITAPDELPAMVSHLSKYASLVPKLALILATCEALAAGRNVEAVDTPSLARAILWAEYLESHARRIYELVEKADETAAKQLLAKIREGKLDDPFTRRGVERKRWAGLRDSATIDAAIAVLEDHDWVRCHLVRSKTNGRDFERVFVNPAALSGGAE